MIVMYDSIPVPQHEAHEPVHYTPPPGWSLVHAERRPFGWVIILKEDDDEI